MKGKILRYGKWIRVVDLPNDCVAVIVKTIHDGLWNVEIWAPEKGGYVFADFNFCTTIPKARAYAKKAALAIGPVKSVKPAKRKRKKRAR